MNKTLIYIIIGVIAVGGIVWLIGKGAGSPFSKKVTTDTSDQQSFKELATSRTSQMCTFSSALGGANTTGTVYVAGGKMRGDFDTMANSTPVKAHMILDGGFVYSWSDTVNMGVKIPVTASTEGEAAAKGFDANQKVDFNCSPWTLDTTKFILPAGVTFTDINNIALPPGVSGSDTIYNK